jgi:hypothetical protein
MQQNRTHSSEKIKETDVDIESSPLSNSSINQQFDKHSDEGLKAIDEFEKSLKKIAKD